MADHAHDDHLAGPEQRKKIWMVFWLLAAVTSAEFVIAFTMDKGLVKNIIFFVMTLFKAFYIIAEFMHLKHEVKSLILTLSLPMIFILWFIVAMLVEGSWYDGGWFRFLAGG